MKEDLAMWLIILKDWNGKASWKTGAEVRLVHDASERGFGFILDGLPPAFDISTLPEHLRGGTGFAGTFADNMVREGSKHSIQFGELFAIVFSITLYGPHLRGHNVLAISDNLADVFIINRERTTAPDLLGLLRLLYATCAYYDIAIRAEHIRGEDNHDADFLSRPEKHLHAPHSHSRFNTRAFHVSFVHSSSLKLPRRLGLPATIA